MSNGARLDRLERKNPSGRLPYSYEFHEEMDRMKADPEYVCKWSQEQVHAWIEQMKQRLDQTPWGREALTRDMAR